VFEASALSNLKSLQGPILVTGHTGFKGTWLVELLESLGFEVVGLSLPAEQDSLRDRIGSERGYVDFFVDVNNSGKVNEIVATINPGFIFHLAAQAIVSEAFANPAKTYLTNMVGTLNVIEAAKNLSQCRGVQVITTDKVYWNDESGKAFSEQDAIFGYDPYSGSKVGAEAVVAGLQSLYKDRHGLLIQSVRAGNVIGGGDFAINRLLPDIVRSILNEEVFVVRNPESTRPWQHVLEPLTGYVMAAERMLKYQDNSPYNFGPTEDSLSVSQVISIVREIWPKLVINTADGKALRMHEAKTLQISPTKAIHELGWTPIFSQQKAIELTINWWDKVLSGKSSPLSAMRSDIELLTSGSVND
jgi:CDP-glucose 4,6-dehydratase